MPEVETTEVVESPAEAPVEEQPEATPKTEDAATLLARLRGKDQAYTKLKAELEQQKATAAELSRWKAEKEASEMTEVERQQARIAELEGVIAAAEARAKKAELAQAYPRATELLGDSLAALDEGAVAAIEERLKIASEPVEPEPPVNPNNPPKVPRTGIPLPKPKGKSDEELIAELATFGNPFLDLA